MNHPMNNEHNNNPDELELLSKTSMKRRCKTAGSGHRADPVKTTETRRHAYR